MGGGRQQREQGDGSGHYLGHPGGKRQRLGVRLRAVEGKLW